VYWTLQNLKDSENKQYKLHHGSIFSAATVVVPIIVGVKYLLLVSTILKVLEGPVHGGNEREMSSCKYRHNEPRKNKVWHRAIHWCGTHCAAIFLPTTVYFIAKTGVGPRVKIASVVL
jgi:hypothetical protein